MVAPGDRVSKWQRDPNPESSRCKTMGALLLPPPRGLVCRKKAGTSVPAGALPCSTGPPKGLDSWLPPSLLRVRNYYTPFSS